MSTTTIQIGWEGDEAVAPRALMQTDRFRRAMQHLAIEIGGREARSHGWRLVRYLGRLARLAEREGVRLTVHSDYRSCAPPPWSVRHGLAVEVVGLRGSDIVWSISLYSGDSDDAITWALTRQGYFREASRADVLLRDIARATAERKAMRRAKAEAAAARYTEGLPEPARTLQRTARATCLRVSADGRSVTEILHDVGGSCTFVNGVNRFAMPNSLADMQKRHDAVYHAS